MSLYETILTEHNSVRIRVRADNPEQAWQKFDKFMNNEPDGNEYLAEELDLNGTKEWTWTPFTPVSPNYYDECATLTENEDGSFDAQYEGGER